MYKKIKNTTLSIAHRLGILGSLHVLDNSFGSSFYALAYHRVDEIDAQPRLDPKNLSATPEQFEEQMRLLSSEYQPISADDVLEAVTGNRKLPPRAVLVTVDDGYLDFKENIWPITKNYGIRPVLFVATAYVGKGVFWWDKLYDALQNTTLQQIESPIGILLLGTKQERQQTFAKLADYMKQSASFEKSLVEVTDLCRRLFPTQLLTDKTTLGWDELRQLFDAGVTIAPHTHNHPALGNISNEQAEFEILESQRQIKAELGSAPALFAYPYGSRAAIGTFAADLLRSSGFQFAFTMSPGRSNLKRDDFMYLPRIPVYPKLSLPQLHAKLTPVFNITTHR